MNHSLWAYHERYLPGVSFDTMVEVDRIRFAHTTGVEVLSDIWIETLERIHNFLPEVRSLELDFTSAYCPTGCCSLIRNGLLLSRCEKLTKLSFLGIRNKQEEAEVMDELDWLHMDQDRDWGYSGGFEMLTKIHSIVFNPETSHWEQWEMDSA
jgi:hypothetical protein